MLNNVIIEFLKTAWVKAFKMINLSIPSVLRL